MNAEKRHFRLPAWLMAGGLSLLLILLTHHLPEPPHRLEYTRIHNRHGMPLWTIIYFPEPPVYARAPAAVLCQPFNSAPEYARLLALELVQDGLVVLTFDWRGRSREENRQIIGTGAREVLRADAVAAAAFLRTLPGVDPEHILIGGQSVGGTLAIEAATEDPRIAAVASIGMEADVTTDRPRNILWTVGLYDEFRVLNRMRDVFQASAATAALEHTTVGNFPQGTARRLDVSPTADHFTELHDHGIQRQVLDWYRQAAGLPPSHRRLSMETRAIVGLLAWLAALVGAILAVYRLAAARPWALRVTAGLACAAVVLLSFYHGPDFLLLVDILWGLTLFTLVTGFICTRPPEVLPRAARWLGRVAAILWVSLLLTLVVNNLADYAHEPRYLFSLPEFAVKHVLDLLYSYLLLGPRPFVLSVYSPGGLSPRLWVYVLLASEVVQPGLVPGLLARIFRASRRAQPAAARPPRRKASALALAALVLLLAGVAWVRTRQGFLTPESALAALRFLLRFTVLPIFIFSLLWRWWGKHEPQT